MEEKISNNKIAIIYFLGGVGLALVVDKILLPKIIEKYKEYKEKEEEKLCEKIADYIEKANKNSILDFYTR